MSSPLPPPSSTNAKPHQTSPSSLPILSSTFAGFTEPVLTSSSFPNDVFKSADAAQFNEEKTEEEEDLTDPKMAYAIKVLVRSILPAAAGFLLEGLLSLSTVVIAGRLGPLPLAIAGRGQAIQMFTGNIITTASCCAQVTLSAPLFTAVRSSSNGPGGGVAGDGGTSGSDDEETVSERTPLVPSSRPTSKSLKSGMGTIAQRAFLLNMLLEIPVVVLWYNIEGVFRWLGQPEGLCRGLREYMLWAMVGIPGYAVLEISKSYLQAQSIFHVPPIIAGIYLPFHLLLTYHLVHRTSLGVYGAPVAMLVAEYTIAAGVTIYILLNRSGSAECWGGWSRKAWSGWSGYLQVMVPAIFMYGAGAWCFEIVSLMAGRLGETAVAAQAAVASLDLFLIMIPTSAALASLARLGNIIGRSQLGVRSAIISVRAIYLIMMSLACFTAAGMIVFRKALASLFTDDRPTAELIERVLIPMALYQVWDYMDCCGGSVLRATAKQHLAASINMVAFYVIALPLAYYMGIYLDKGLPAMWAALNIGLFSVALFTLIYYNVAIDWPKEMAHAEKRREKGEE